MKAIKYEIYVPQHLRQAVLQYLRGHVAVVLNDKDYLCVIAEKTKEFETALDEAFAYVKANTARDFIVVVTPCTMIKD